MKKFCFRLLALTLCITLLCTGLVHALQPLEDGFDGSVIEISFLLGDDTLLINGQPVTVKAPNAVDGTTVVPLRVITEAFGAKVEWDGGIGITLTYRDTVIALELDNKIAVVNGKEMELLRAPVVENGDGITMVPLRFVSEQFGAEVDYDAETGRITVVKHVTDSESITDFSAILNRSSKAKVGDSYFGWSMSLQKNMRLTYRSFDGTYHSFYDEASDAELEFVIYTELDEDIVDLYQQEKDWASRLTLIRQERKGGADGNTYVETEAKSSSTYYYRRVTVSGRNTYDLELFLPASMSLADRAPYIQLIESFSLSFPTDDTVEDLSDLDEDNLRTYQSDEMGISILVPADFYQLGNGSKTNEVRFYKPLEGSPLPLRVIAAVFSIRPGEQVDEWAGADLKVNQGLFNPNVVSFSGLQSMTLAGQPARYYTHVYRGQLTYDVFFYDKDYGYNVSVTLPVTQEDLLLQILDSFRYTPLDPAVEGHLARDNRDDIDLARSHTLPDTSFSFDMPLSYAVYGDTSALLLLTDANYDAILMCTSVPKDGRSLRSLTSEYQTYLGDRFTNFTTTQSPKNIQTANGINAYIVHGRYTDGSDAVVIKSILFGNDEGNFQFIFIYPDDFDGAQLGGVWQGVLDSLSEAK